MTKGLGSGGSAPWLLAVCVALPSLFLGIPLPSAAPVTAAAPPLQDPEPPVETPPTPEPEQEQEGGGGEQGGEEQPDPVPPEEPEVERPIPEQGEQATGEEPAAETPPRPEPVVGPPGGASVPDAGAPEATPSTPPVAEAQPEPDQPPSLPAFTPAYRSMGEGARLLAALAEASPGVANTFELGRTHDGRPVFGLELGRSGDLPLAERPTIFLFGGLDGRSLAGGEAVLGIVHDLLSSPEELPEQVAFVAVPWVSGQALSLLADQSGTASSRDGRNGRPLDDDRDGRIDEDGPDDLDGDGMILDMLIEDARGPWTRGGDGRLLVPAGPGDGTRYIWTREGRDDDGDGRFNEDPPGGVVLDRNFPVHRTGPWDDPRCGEVPMSEPLVRALAELVLARRAAVVLLLQGNHGRVATPGGLAADPTADAFDPADRPVFERVTEAFLAATGRSQPGLQTLRQARGEVAPGAALDWLHAVAGALSLEVAPWGPEVESSTGVVARDARYATPENAALQKPRSLAGRPHLGEVEGAWERWLDNTHGGLGFVDWHPVELGGGYQGLVGGWEPRTILNPPAESLPRALEGLPEFVRELATGLPRLEVRVTQSEREGELVRLRAHVRNLGRLPSGMTRPGVAGVELTVELPSGAVILAGESTARLPRLLGGELSAEKAWVILAPEGSTLRLRASAGWTLPVVREVRP